MNIHLKILINKHQIGQVPC